MAKRPFLPFYFKDFRDAMKAKGVSRKAQAIYIELLGWQWELGELPDDLRKLATMTGEHWLGFQHAWEELSGFFQAIPCRSLGDPSSISRRSLVNPRLRLEQDRADLLSEKNAKAAEIRWSGDADASITHMPKTSLTQSQSQTHKQKTEETIPKPPSAVQGESFEVQQKSLKPKQQKAKRERKKNPHHADAVVVVDFYRQEWLRTRSPADGKPPVIDSADFKVSLKLVALVGKEEALKLVQKFLDDPDNWLVEQGHRLCLLSKRVNGYRATKRPKQQELVSQPISKAGVAYGPARPMKHQAETTKF